MALKKTIHGEKLEERRPYAGVHAKRCFRTREVFCPRCGAKPHRKCEWSRAELQGEYCIWTRRWWGRTASEAEREARRRTRKGYDHGERRARATDLTALAQVRRGPARPLFRVAVAEAPDKRRTITTFDRLPLFERDRDG